MPPDTHLFAERLVHVLPPAAPSAAQSNALAHYDVLAERLRGRLDLVDAWRLRLPLLPEPPRRESLADLVQEARRRLREDRSQADLAELRERLTLVDQLRAGLAP